MKFPLIELTVQNTTLGTFFKIWKQMETTFYMVCPLHAKPKNEKNWFLKALYIQLDIQFRKLCHFEVCLKPIMVEWFWLNSQIQHEIGISAMW